MTTIGHNGIAADQLRSIVERIERLEEEKKALATDIREVYAEAKANGYDPKIIRQIVKLRKLDAAERAEQEALIETYMHALGMLADTPLGEAAIAKVAANPAVKRALKRMGTPVPVTEEERKKGIVGSFEKDGMRTSIGFPEREA